MKTIILTVLVVIASVTASLTAHAGPRIVGNGGIAVQEGNKLYMLDLYERSVHKKPFYLPNVKPLKEVQENLERVFSMANMDSVPMERLVYKMSEVYQKSYILAWQFEQAISKLDWRLVDAELVPSEDARTPLDGLELKQVAIRINNVVYINQSMWDKLDNHNKVALILHEASYFFVKPQITPNVSGTFQHAASARSLAGLVFTKRFSVEGVTRLNSGSDLPNATGVLFEDKNTLVSSIRMSILPGSYNPTAVEKPFGSAGRDLYFDKNLDDVEEVITSYGQTACSQMAAKLTKEERSKPTVPFKIQVELSGTTLDSRIWFYTLKNGESQDYLEVSRKGVGGGNYYSTDSVLPTKTFAASCFDAVRYDLKKVLSTLKYKIK